MTVLSPPHAYGRVASVRQRASRKSAATISQRDRRCTSSRLRRCSPRETRQKCEASSAAPVRCYVRGQHYSVTALTDSSAVIKERYAYDAYGGLSVFDGSGTARTTAAEGNRYTYTGREWDEKLALYHYRARMYDPICGRFCSRDPIGFEGSEWNLYESVESNPIDGRDPLGMTRECDAKENRRLCYMCCKMKHGGRSGSHMRGCKNSCNARHPPMPPLVPPASPLPGPYADGIVTCTRYPGNANQFLCFPRCGKDYSLDYGLYIIEGTNCRLFTAFTCKEFIEGYDLGGGSLDQPFA
ncbi:RHS repeat domain-containing protein [Stieleria tagensis]|uniref:RHS repeat domain-containing protein n=1 Tax=Stieleria tagensis TaxID=2956795 RepID=UPI0036F3D87F